MNTITSLVRLNITEFVPLCPVCKIYDTHECIQCDDCEKELCLKLGKVFINSKNNKPYCFDCRISLIKQTNTTFELLK